MAFLEKISMNTNKNISKESMSYTLKGAGTEERLASTKQLDVSLKSLKWIEIGQNQENRLFNVLIGIRDSNIKNIKNKVKGNKHNNLLSIMSNPFILATAYVPSNH